MYAIIFSPLSYSVRKPVNATLLIYKLFFSSKQTPGIN